MLYQILTSVCLNICCKYEGHFPLRIAEITRITILSPACIDSNTLARCKGSQCTHPDQDT